uniref:Tail assembly chaperone n=1 Tax=Mycobacterium phage Pharb TaxID=3136626 RepID=A0AAU8GQB9_9VIRU
MSDRKGLGPLMGVEIDGVLYTDELRRLRQPQPNPWAALDHTMRSMTEMLAEVLGMRVQPKPPTVREAAEDLYDAARMFLRVLFAAVAAVCGRVGAAVAGRWCVLRARRWGRTRGPLIRLWSAEWDLVSIVHAGRVEPWPSWLRRQVAFVWAVVRNGA